MMIQCPQLSLRDFVLIMLLSSALERQDTLRVARRIVGAQGAAVMGWTGEGFYKNNSLTDNLLASSLWRPRVPFWEGAFLFQPHTESPESQGCLLNVLIAAPPPLFKPECLFRWRQEWNEGFKNINEAFTKHFFLCFQPDEFWGARRARAAPFDWLTLRSSWKIWCLISLFAENKPEWKKKAAREKQPFLWCHMLLFFHFLMFQTSAGAERFVTKMFWYLRKNLCVIHVSKAVFRVDTL